MIHRFRHPWLVAILVLASSLLGAVEADTGQPRTWRIMCVGDSITEGGSSFRTYRPILFEMLRAAHHRVVAVGSRTSTTTTGPLAHEGYGGKDARFLATVVPASFSATPADIVLIHAGHNGDAAKGPVPGLIEATARMITSFRATNPRVIILVAQVIPSSKLPKYSYIPELNAELSALVQRMQVPEQPLILVDQWTGFDVTTDLVADQVHPNAAGAQKIAHRWFDALVPILGKNPPQP